MQIFDEVSFFEYFFLSLMFFILLNRKLIQRLVPQQGQGPSQDMLDNGYLQIGFWGRGRGPGGEEVVVKGGVHALHGDPGYR